MPTVVPSTPFPVDDSTGTSGTVGQTFIDTVQLIEHACRRCLKNPALLTPEQLDTARNNLYFILCALSNRGINLWAVDETILSLVANQAGYQLPAGTESIINIAFREIKRMDLSSTVLSGLPVCSATLTVPDLVKMVGFKFADTVSSRFIVEYTADGIQWQTAFNYNDVSMVGGWHWLTFDPPVQAQSVRLRDTTGAPLALVDMLLCKEYRDVPLSNMNRDSYTGLTNKLQNGTPLNYNFEKLLMPKLMLWPVPIKDSDVIVVWRQRRVQDVGELAQRLEVPDRWFESIIWSLAKNLSFELPDITPERIQLIIAQAADALRDAELGESDGAPMYIAPNISGYTR